MEIVTCQLYTIGKMNQFFLKKSDNPNILIRNNEFVALK